MSPPLHFTLHSATQKCSSSPLCDGCCFMRIINFIVTLNKLFAINTWKHRPTYSRDNGTIGTNCPVKLRFRLIPAFTPHFVVSFILWGWGWGQWRIVLQKMLMSVFCWLLQKQNSRLALDFQQYRFHKALNQYTVTQLTNCSVDSICIVISDGGSWVTAVPLLAAIHGQQLSSNNNRHRYMALCCTVLCCTVLHCTVEL